jgi:alkaline phosphatase D
MTARLLLFLIACLLNAVAFTQKLVVSGPMLGPVELRDAKVWLEVTKDVKSVSVMYKKKGNDKLKTINYKGSLGNEFNPLQITIGGLEFNTTYEYVFVLNGKVSGSKGEFTTKDLWQWRKPAPDFSFIAGSCAYFNEPVFDRPGTPYGKDSSIFETMAKEKSAFMLWLGDNWYTRDVDYYSEWGLWYRVSKDRSVPVLQNLLKMMPHVATWDDHDFGPNNSSGSYILKDVSREIWKQYWCNPSHGENGKGIYTMHTWGDIEIFLTDDRTWRSADRTKDSVDGKPNPEKKMLGKQQMEWLKNSLLNSFAVFKIVVVGSQVLNPASPFDKLKEFPAEYDELMRFLVDNKVNGVLFMTGDRHHTEIIKVDRPGTYPLYDITVSPLTSGTHKFGGPEQNNPYRVYGLDEKQNYGRFTVSGKRGERKFTAEFLGVKGEKLGEWSINEKDLKSPQ